MSVSVQHVAADGHGVRYLCGYVNANVNNLLAMAVNLTRAYLAWTAVRRCCMIELAKSSKLLSRQPHQCLTNAVALRPQHGEFPQEDTFRVHVQSRSSCEVSLSPKFVLPPNCRPGSLFPMRCGASAVTDFSRVKPLIAHTPCCLHLLTGT